MKDERFDEVFQFGKEVIVESRDLTLREIFRMIDGKAKARISVELYKLLSTFTDEQKTILKMLLLDSVDHTISNFLWMVEQSDSKYLLMMKDKKGKYFDLEKESDGLCLGQWYFIDDFSKYNKIENILETGEIEKKYNNGS